jgi:hypothetical protein
MIETPEVETLAAVYVPQTDIAKAVLGIHTCAIFTGIQRTEHKQE